MGPARNDRRAQPLRVGVALGSNSPPAWVHDLLTRIESSAFSTLSAVVIIDTPVERPADGAGARMLKLLEALDERLFAAEPDALARSKPAAFRLQTRTVHAPSQADAAVLLAGQELGVVLALDVEPDGLEGCAAHGVWSVGFAAARRATEAPPYFWELRDRRPTVEVVIRADPGGRVLYLGHTPAEPLSLRRLRTVAAWKAARAVLLRLQELHSAGAESLLGHAEEAPLDEPTRRVGVPNVLAVGLLVLLGGLRRLVAARLRRGEWFVAYRKRDGREPWDAASYRLLPSPPGRFFADPFLLERDGRHFLFLEDFVEAKGKAVVSAVELGEDGLLTDPEVALEREYHLSYPCVFELDDDDDVYMIPETSAAKRVELYRADPFPSRWRFERVLLTGVVADDATLLQHDGRLWLFVNIAPDGTGPMNGELFLYFADSIAGEWLPHPWNPIVADVRSARPAGRVFRRDGRLIRPSQDCARRYGHATVFNQIETLTTTEYRERPVARLDPDWIPGNLGTHSYGSDAAFEVVDGYCERWRFPFGRAQT